jgi:adenylate cyclase
VIVLPFVESGAPPQDYFVDAITDDITTQLSKIKGSTVIGSPTAFTYRQDRPDIAAIAREMGVRYVLQGRVQRHEDTVEVNARLSDSATGAVIWSDLIEVERSGMRNIRRELVGRLANALDLELQQAEARRIAAERPSNPEAVDLVMQGRAAGGGNWTRPSYDNALALYERALAIDPDNAEALTLRAQMYATLANAWPSPRIAEHLARAEADVLRALSLDSFDPRAYLTLSIVRQQQFRLDEAFAANEAGLQINPNDARLHAWRGDLYRYSGRSDLAFEPLLRALSLSPRDPFRWTTYGRLSTCSILIGDYTRALKYLEQVDALHAYWLSGLGHAAVQAVRGDRPAASAQWARYLRESEPHRHWLRSSDCPAYVAQIREHVYSPLVEVGVLEDFAYFEQWSALQTSGAARGRVPADG